MPNRGGGLEAAGAGEPPVQGSSFLRAARSSVMNNSQRMAGAGSSGGPGTAAPTR